MYVGRPSVSADSDRSSALIAQMQATAHAASFSSSHPVDNTPDTKHGNQNTHNIYPIKFTVLYGHSLWLLKNYNIKDDRSQITMTNI